MKQKLILFIKQKLSRIAAYIRGDLIAHYIGGGDMLPPPLTHEEEAELLAALSDSGRAEGAKKTLIERNLRLVVYIAKKFENWRRRGGPYFNRHNRSYQGNQHL